MLSNTDKETLELNMLLEHKSLVGFIVRGFKNTGINEQDLFQEGLIALYRAVQSYNADSSVKFETYASRVIKNRLIDLVRKEKEASRVLNDHDTSGLTLEDEFDMFQKHELINDVLNTQCTDIERAIFKSYSRGHSYDEISKIFDVSKKKIDNTIQKVRNKIKTLF